MKKFLQITPVHFLKNERVAGGFGELLEGRFYFPQYGFRPLLILPGSDHPDVSLHNSAFYFVAYLLHRSFIYSSSRTGSRWRTSMSRVLIVLLAAMAWAGTAAAQTQSTAPGAHAVLLALGPRIRRELYGE